MTVQDYFIRPCTHGAFSTVRRLSAFNAVQPLAASLAWLALHAWCTLQCCRRCNVLVIKRTCRCGCPVAGSMHGVSRPLQVP